MSNMAPTTARDPNWCQPRTIDTGRLARIDPDLATEIDILSDQIIDLIFADEQPEPSHLNRLQQLQTIHRGLNHLSIALIEHLGPQPEAAAPAESCTW